MHTAPTATQPVDGRPAVQRDDRPTFTGIVARQAAEDVADTLAWFTAPSGRPVRYTAGAVILDAEDAQLLAMAAQRFLEIVNRNGGRP